MTKETLPAVKSSSAFLVENTENKDHIVDTLIKERCPSFVGHWSWALLRPALYGLLGYSKARRLADHMASLNGRGSFDHMSQKLTVQLTLNKLDTMPRTGRLVVTANHPTGLADGIAVWDALKQVRDDITFLANADAMRVNPNFSDTIIPVEWVEAKRSPAKTRETLRLAKEAFQQERCIVIFPSGKLAKKVDGKLTEQDWMPTAVSLARKYKAPVQPLNVQATNSWLYYLLSQISGELRDVTLFRELLNKTSSPFEMTFGPLIAPEQLQGDTNQMTLALREYVATTLIEKPSLQFGMSNTAPDSTA